LVLTQNLKIIDKNTFKDHKLPSVPFNIAQSGLQAVKGTEKRKFKSHRSNRNIIGK
jgi:hypothetical protein